MLKNNYPILEFDPTPNAILEPSNPKLSIEAPKYAIACFFQDVIDELRDDHRLQRVGTLKSEMGNHPLYLLEYESQQVLVFHPGVGAALAAAFFEEVISLGPHFFIACGGCGVLDGNIVAGFPFIITSAVRDEGTSYHYLPPAREVTANLRVVSTLEKVFQNEGITYQLVKTWTTDAIYRETEQRRQRRLCEGCGIVEMEAAAFFAVAQFRKVDFGQIVYAGDAVIPGEWNMRGWNEMKVERQRLFWLAVKTCLQLKDQ